MESFERKLFQQL